MSNPEIEPEIIATIRSAHAMSIFTKYIADHDESLTHVEAMTIASAVVESLPILFDVNPQLFTDLMATLSQDKKTPDEPN